MEEDFFAFEQEGSPVPQLVNSAYGTVLELGPATGNQVSSFDMSKVEKIHGIEPLESMHEPLRKKVEASGWAGKYEQLVCNVEDANMLAGGSIDCAVSVQVLCSVQNPKWAVKKVYDVLKPGRKLVFWEHCRSNDRLTRLIQREC